MTNLTTTIQNTLDQLRYSGPPLPGNDDIAIAVTAAIQELHDIRARRSADDTRLIGSPLDLVDGDPEHRAQLEHHRAQRPIYEPADFRDGPRHVIVGERQEGKTWIAEQWLLSAPAGVERVLVTVSLAEAAVLKDRMGLDRNDPRVISFHSLIGPGRSAKAGVEYGFDETVRMLEQLLRLKQPPHLLTITTAAEWQGRDALTTGDHA